MQSNYKIKCVLITFILCVIFNPLLSAEPTVTAPKVRTGYIKVEGGKLFYQSFGFGEPIVVLHGGPGLDQTYLLPQMQKLARHNTVTFYDQRGSGQSLGFDLNEKSITMERFVKDLEAVRKQLNYPKMILVGHSWGGLLAMNYAISYPERVSKLVLMDSAPASSVGFKAFLHEYMQRTAPLSAKLQQIQDTIQFQDFDPNIVAQFYRTIFSVYFYKPTEIDQLTLKFSRASAKSGLKVSEIFSQNYLLSYDLKQQLSKLKMPVLVVHGDKDIIPVWTAYELNGLIPKSKLVIIKDSDHFPYIEQPEQLFTAVEEFTLPKTNISRR